MLNTITTFIAGITMAFASIFSPAPLELPEPTIDPDYEYQDLGAFSPAAGGTYRLKSSIGTTNTTITLSSFKEPISNTPLTMDNLATDIGYGTLDPQSSTRKEFISFTGITQNSDGSAQLTGVTRGLGFTSPFTASSTLRKSHPGQSIFILSDSPQLFNEYARRRSDETITGSWTIPTPTAAGNPATKAYVDAAITGTSSISYDRQIEAGDAGETIASGQIVYFDSVTNNEWMLADASTVTTAANVQLGIAQGAGTDGNPISGGVLRSGYDETQTGMSAGNTIYLSDTAGATSTSAGTISVILGEARNATVLYFDPVFGNYAGTSFDNTFTGQNTFSATTTFSGESLEIGLINIVASSTFTGATTPQPVHFNNASSTAHLADANQSDRTNVIGFAINSASIGSDVLVQTKGIVSGFSGLTTGDEYYLSDTEGTISTSTGTYSIKLGIAVSASELLIEKQNRYASGSVDAGTVTATGTNSPTLTFLPDRIKLKAYTTQGTAGVFSTCDLVWTPEGSTGISASMYHAESGTDYQDIRVGCVITSGDASTNRLTFTIDSVTSTGFTITYTETGSFSTDVGFIWTAEGTY